jgi:hypothetical protein
MEVKYSLIAVFVLFAAGLLFAVSSQAKIDPETIAGMWLFDEDEGEIANDSSGNGNNGTLTNRPRWDDGKFGSALEFDGAADIIQLPDMGHSETVTIEVWLKAYSFPQYAGLVSAPTSDPGMVHFKLRSSRAVSVDKRDNANSLDSPPINPEEWVHALFTCDTIKDEVRLYVNGELIGTDVPGPTPVDMTGLMIGREKGDRYFHGVLDEVRIYNRVLSEDEINQNFNVKSNAMSVDPSERLTICWGEIKL